MIFVNFKTSPNALKLAQICHEVAKETGVKIWPVIKPADLDSLASIGIEVWLQYWNGGGLEAEGVILNHSDYPLTVPAIQKKIEDCRKNKLQILVCTDSFEIGREVARLKPDYLAFEPPELIGGKISVASARPEIIRDFVQAIPGIPILAGAGINTVEDVKRALELGAVGLLVSKAVIGSGNPKQKLLELSQGFK